MQLKKKSAHIHRLLSIAMLWVFMLALTPWSSFHHHQEVKTNCSNETICSHKVHISTHADQCLVCSAHFEKNYFLSHHFINVYQDAGIYIANQHLEPALYTKLIRTALRGPPVA